MARRAWATWGLVVCGALALQAWTLWGERWGVAANGPSRPNWPVGEIAEGITAEQTFVMRAPGLRAFTFTPRAAGPTVAGDVIFDIADVTPEGDRSLFRVVKKATAVVTDGRPYTVEFSPIELSVPRTFKVRIALPGARLGEGFFIDGVEHDRYPAGVLVVNHREVWGDLVFETDARGARLVERVGAVVGAYPSWAARPAVVLGALGAVNVLVGWVVWIAVRSHRDEKPGRPAAEWRLSVGVRALAATIRQEVLAHPVVCAGVVMVLATAAWTAASERSRVLVDLIDEFPRAVKATSMPSLHDGFAIFNYPTVGVVEPCILALPPSRITWTVDVGAAGMLAVRVGLRSDTWLAQGDGAVFRVGVASERGGYEELRREHLDPIKFDLQRVYTLWRFDLGRFAGQRVNIVFNTEPGPSNNAVSDAAMWCVPRLLSP